MMLDPIRWALYKARLRQAALALLMALLEYMVQDFLMEVTLGLSHRCIARTGCKSVKRRPTVTVSQVTLRDVLSLLAVCGVSLHLLTWVSKLKLYL